MIRTKDSIEREIIEAAKLGNYDKIKDLVTELQNGDVYICDKCHNDIQGIWYSLTDDTSKTDFCEFCWQEICDDLGESL